MIGHLARVVLDAADERGPAPPQHGQPQRVEPRAVDHAALVPQVALRVDHGHVQPAVIGPEARRPHDRADLAAAQVELQPRRRRHPRRLEPFRRPELGVAPAGQRPLVEGVEQAPQLEVGEREHVAQAAGEQRAAVPDHRPPAHQLDAQRGERVEVERRPLGRPDQLGRGQPPGPGEVVHLVVPLVPHARGVHPPQHVTPAVDARQPHVLPDRQGHRPAGALQLGGQLHAGRRRPDHEHAAVGELVRVAVVERRELLDRRGHLAGERRDRGPVAGAARDDHGPAGDLAVARRDQVTVPVRPHRGDVRRRSGRARGRPRRSAR